MKLGRTRKFVIPIPRQYELRLEVEEPGALEPALEVEEPGSLDTGLQVEEPRARAA